MRCENVDARECGRRKEPAKTDMPSFFPHKRTNCGVQQTMFRVKRLEPASKKRWPPDDLSPLQYQKIAHLPTH